MRRSRSNAGFTLVELGVGVFLLAIVVLAGLRTADSLATQVLRFRDQTANLTELRITVDTLLEDLGKAKRVSLMTFPHRGLVVVREPEVAAREGSLVNGEDAGVIYRTLGTDLIRSRRSDSTEILVSRGIHTFELENLGRTIQITIAAEEGYPTTRHAVTLVTWKERPTP